MNCLFLKRCFSIRFISSTLFGVLVTTLIVSSAWAQDGDEEPVVGITPSLQYIEVEHDGKPFRIERIQDTENMIDFDYALTSRPCPPFCIQPMKLAPGVETIGELELLDYLQRMHEGDASILLVDSREPNWTLRGMIPGAVNIPWTRMDPERGSYEDIAEVMDVDFGVEREHGLWHFESASTLIMYCNGPWCGQSPANIKTLLSYGYPAHKIKWYRGGMQSWQGLGFPVVEPEE